MARFFKRLFLVLALLNWLVIPAYSATLLTLTGFGLGGAAGGAPSSVIQSIQQGSITIAAASLTNTATISSVTTSKAILIFDGSTTTETTSSTNSSEYAARIDLTNATTVTATRGNSAQSVTVKFTVIEFASGVNSIQAGTIAMSAIQSTNTATISAVGANAFVIWLGASTTATTLRYGEVQGSVALTNSTTVTANCFLTSALTVGYMVVDLDSSIVDSVQPVSKTDASANTSYTSTISSVVTGQTILIQGGILATATLGVVDGALTTELTNATTITFTRNSTSATSRTINVTAVQFNSAVVNSLQRGTITFSAATTATATISSVTTAKSFANFGRFLAGFTGADSCLTALALTNSTTVTGSRNTGNAVVPTVAYEVLEFK